MILSPFSLLLTSPPASGVFLGRHFVVIYDNVTVSLVPPTPLLGTAPLRDRWFAVGTLASLCGSLQQRGPLSLRKFSLSGLGAALPRCGLGPPT